MSSSSATTTSGDMSNSNMPADISKRHWIRWADNQFTYESTYTIVLTAPSQAFIDIRLRMPPTQTPPHITEAVTNNSAAGITQLEWAFSGITQTIHREPHMTQKRWLHIIDSKYPYGVMPPLDEGDMYDLPESPNFCLEKGVMLKPGTNHIVPYDEMWESLPIEVVGSDTKRTCIVASLDHPEAKQRGIVIRLGQYCQALMMVDAQVHVERWAHFPANPLGRTFPTPYGKLEDAGGWTRTAKMGGALLPCAWLFEAQKVAVGHEMTHHSEKWTVREKVEW